jgi:hypothetical protein
MKFLLESFGTCSVDVKREDLAQSWPTWCRVVCRDDVAQVGQEPMVYILIGDARSAYYVGEATDARKRLSEHLGGFSWWNRALVFHHRSGAFGNSGTRKYLQQGLFDKMRALGPAIVFASKVAGSQEPENGAAPILDQIYQFCRILSILPFCASSPDLFVGGAISAIVPVAEPLPPPPQKTETKILPETETGTKTEAETGTKTKKHPEPEPHKEHHPPLGSWHRIGKLARAIAERNGKPGTAGGIEQKLTNFWAPGRGRYAKANPETRAMLEYYGVEFDDEGFVKSCANVPLQLRKSYYA